MSENASSRRRFLTQSGSAFGATWLAMSLPAVLSSCRQTWDEIESPHTFTNLTTSEATELEAVIAQLIPTTDTPGAREAGVIYFLDTAFGSFYAPLLDPVRQSLAAIAQGVAESNGGDGRFSSLADDEQIEILTSLENEPWFGLLTFITVAGMFSHPKHGGNRDKAGWGLLGFDDRHAWQPPFGYYDAEAQNAQ